MTRRTFSSRRSAGSWAGPRTSEDATTDGTTSEVGRAATSDGEASTSPSCSSSIGNSFLNFANFRCCFCHFEQFSPLEHLCGLGRSCSIATIDADSAGEITSFAIRVLRARLRPNVGDLPWSSSGVLGLEQSFRRRSRGGTLGAAMGELHASSAGVEGTVGLLPRNTRIPFQRQ